MFYTEKVHTLCLRCVLTLHRMHVQSRVFYTTISQRSCHAQHSNCSQNAAGYSIFNIQEFQNAFSKLHFTVSKRILHGKSGYRVHTVCFIPRYRSDPAMYSTLRATKMYPYTPCSTYKSFKLVFHHHDVL